MTISRGDVVLVTGATGAIGFEIAAQATEAGAIVAVHGSSADSVAKAVERLRERVTDAQLIAAPADFRSDGAIEAMVEKVAVEARRIDAVIHCGITGAARVAGPFAKADPANFGEHAALVLGSFQTLCYSALPHLSVRGGTIIGFASDAGKFAAPRQSVIGAAFGGIMSFARNLALEVARQGVRVHCISPSFVADTPAFEDMPRGREPPLTGQGLACRHPKTSRPWRYSYAAPMRQKSPDKSSVSMAD